MWRAARVVVVVVGMAPCTAEAAEECGMVAAEVGMAAAVAAVVVGGAGAGGADRLAAMVRRTMGLDMVAAVAGAGAAGRSRGAIGIPLRTCARLVQSETNFFKLNIPGTV